MAHPKEAHRLKFLGSFHFLKSLYKTANLDVVRELSN